MQRRLAAVIVAEMLARPDTATDGPPILLKVVREINVAGLAIKPRQFKVSLKFKGNPFTTVPVELSPAEGKAVLE